MSTFQDRAFLVTGAASGIGLATARLLRAFGARLALWDQQAAPLASAARDLGAHVAVVDVADGPAVAQAMTDSVAALGGLDGVIHCAGILRAGAFENLPLAAHEAVVRVNLLGSLNTAHAALPHLRATHGSLVLVASVSAFSGAPEYAVYGATKAGVLNLAQALRVELRGSGVHVGVICPLFVQTPMLQGHNGATRMLRSGSPFFEVRPPERVAPLILTGIERRRFLIPIGWKARLLYLISRYGDFLLHPLTIMTDRQGRR